MIEANDKSEGTYGPIEYEREGFVHKVFGILAFQLTITSVFCLYATTDSGFKFFLANSFLLIIMLVLSIATLIPLACCVGVARKVPGNYILLTLFTIGEGYCVGFCCAFYDPVSVYFAILMTAGITISLAFYAMYTKKDYTMMGGMLFCLLIGLILMGFIAALTGGETMRKVYAGCGAILFSFYIVFDVQLILGRGNYKYSVDDYILAAVNVYLDIINLLLYLLELFGEKRQ